MPRLKGINIRGVPTKKWSSSNGNIHKKTGSQNGNATKNMLAFSATTTEQIISCVVVWQAVAHTNSAP